MPRSACILVLLLPSGISPKRFGITQPRMLKLNVNRVSCDVISILFGFVDSRKSLDSVTRIRSGVGEGFSTHLYIIFRLPSDE